jgi:hypothetical protein
LFQTLTFVDMADVVQGDGAISYYFYDLTAKWALFDAPGAGLAGWLSAEVVAKTGLGTAGQTQSAQSNLGTLTDPTGFWLPLNGFQLPELAWQQSLRRGEVVLLAGILDQSNYLDWNAYAGSRSIGHLGLRHARVRTAACPTRPGGEQGSRYLSLTEQGRPDSGELPRPRETPHSDDHGNPGAERRDSRMGTTERQVRREDLAIPAGARPARSRPGARGPVAIRGLVRYNLRRRGSLAGPRPPATPRLRRIIRERRARDGMGGTWCGGRKGPT